MFFHPEQETPQTVSNAWSKASWRKVSKANAQTRLEHSWVEQQRFTLISRPEHRQLGDTKKLQVTTFCGLRSSTAWDSKFNNYSQINIGMIFNVCSYDDVASTYFTWLVWVRQNTIWLSNFGVVIYKYHPLPPHWTKPTSNFPQVWEVLCQESWGLNVLTLR